MILKYTDLVDDGQSNYTWELFKIPADTVITVKNKYGTYFTYREGEWIGLITYENEAGNPTPYIASTGRPGQHPLEEEWLDHPDVSTEWKVEDVSNSSPTVLVQESDPVEAEYARIGRAVINRMWFDSPAPAVVNNVTPY